MATDSSPRFLRSFLFGMASFLLFGGAEIGEMFMSELFGGDPQSVSNTFFVNFMFLIPLTLASCSWRQLQSFSIAAASSCSF